MKKKSFASVSKVNWTEHLQTKSEWNWKKNFFFRICTMLILVYYSHIDDGKKMVKYSRHHWYTTILCRRGIEIQLVHEHIQTNFVCVCCVIVHMNVETSRASHAIAMYSMIVYCIRIRLLHYIYYPWGKNVLAVLQKCTMKNRRKKTCRVWNLTKWRRKNIKKW